MKRNINKLYWIPVILICIIIFYFSSRTGAESRAQSDPIADYINRLLGLNTTATHSLIVIIRKSGHIIEFALLGITLTLAIDKTYSKNHKYLLSLCLAYIYAVFDEFHQLFVAQRSGSFVDTLVDLVGIVIGIGFYVIYKRIKK